MKKYTGYLATDYQKPYAQFYNATINPANEQVLEAVAQSPLELGSIFAVLEAPSLAK